MYFIHGPIYKLLWIIGVSKGVLLIAKKQVINYNNLLYNTVYTCSIE